MRTRPASTTTGERTLSRAANRPVATEPSAAGKLAAVYRYLSLEWLDVSPRTSPATPSWRSWRRSTRSASPRWSRVPEGDVTYYLQLADGAAGFAPARRSPRTSAWRRTGTPRSPWPPHQLAAQEAFIKGRIRLTGDQQKLIDAQPVFAAMDGVFVSVRDHTDYR